KGKTHGTKYNRPPSQPQSNQCQPCPAPPGKQRKWPIDRQIVEWSNDLNEKKNSKNGERQGSHCQPGGRLHGGVIINRSFVSKPAGNPRRETFPRNAS